MTIFTNVELLVSDEQTHLTTTSTPKVNGEKYPSHAVTLTLITVLKLTELFSYTTIYSNFKFLDQLFLSYHAYRHTDTQTDAQLYRYTDTQKNNNEKSIVAVDSTQL